MPPSKNVLQFSLNFIERFHHICKHPFTALRVPGTFDAKNNENQTPFLVLKIFERQNYLRKHAKEILEY